jgi:hypothetical protein
VPTDVVRAKGNATTSVDASTNSQRVKRFNTFSIFEILNINPPPSHYGIGRWQERYCRSRGSGVRFESCYSSKYDQYSFTLETLTRLSSVGVERTKMDDTYLEMML